MSLEIATEKFKEACLAIAPNSRFSQYTRADLATIAKYLPISEDLYLWYELAAPQQNVSIHWTANDLELFAPNKLLEYQVGYRWQGAMSFDLDSLVSLVDWQDEWLVIGWIGGDPIIAKVDETPNPILMAYHGMGYWKPESVAPNLASFLNFLTEWCKLIDEYKGVRYMYDDDSVLLPRVLDHLKEIAKQSVGESFSETLMKYLWS